MKMTKKLFLMALVSMSLLTYASPNDDLVNACKQGDMAGVSAAINAGADVNATDASGNTPIGSAFFWPEITKLLLDKGADPNGGNYPALLQACASYSTEVVRMLLDAGADPNKPGLTDGSGTYKALIDAENAKGKKKNKAMIKAWEDAMASAGKTITYPANAFLIGSNHVPALKMMIEKGMKLEFEDGSNALQTFVNYCNSREMRKEAWAQSAVGYARFGFKVPDWVSNLTDDRNGTAIEMLELLLSTGIDINKKDANGFTPLCATLKGTILAVENTKNAKIDVAKMLIEKGADVNASSTMTNSDWTYYPICLATEIGDMSLMKLLVEKGANLDNTVKSTTITLFSEFASIMGNGGSGYNALIIAILKGNAEMVKFLIEQGADPTIGVEGFATLESEMEGLKCLTYVKNKSAIYWAIEKGVETIFTSVAERLAGVKLPDFSVRTYADSGHAEANTMTESWHCVKFKKTSYPPYEYADLIGNKAAVKYLSGVKLELRK